jgi:hypothetical protein
VIFVEGDDFVHRFFRCVAASLRLLDLLRVSALLDDEIEDVKHVGNWCALSRAVICEVVVFWLLGCFDSLRNISASCWWGLARGAPCKGLFRL